MKQLNSHIVNELDDATLKKQMQVGQTVQKINTLMDVAEGLNTQEWDGVQKINILIQIENKLIDLIEEL
tara:strand:- start:2713 stop:2919 length:207 start_codon:yes stop_codon:yes gene_type:complete